jgi:hypothetical protein
MSFELLKNKRGQMEIPIITFIVIVAGLIILAPFVLKIMGSILTPFGSAVGNVTTEAGTNVAFIQTTFVNFWDWVILIAFTINVVMLVISAFLVNTHPIFLVMYIIFGIFTFIFAPMIKDILDKIYADPNFALQVSQLPITDFLREYLAIILLVIFFISGIIMYSKIRGGNQ